MKERNKMKNEDKQLLLKDISARLPYGVIGQCEIDASYDTSFDTIFQTHKFDAVVYGIKEDLLLVTPLIEDKDEQEFANEEVADGVNILDFKPYLVPLSDMTEEQDKEYALLQTSAGKDGFLYVWNCANMVKWLIENNFDYNGLIPKGLAIAVTKENNPYERK